jgi:hypothetical protein
MRIRVKDVFWRRQSPEIRQWIKFQKWIIFNYLPRLARSLLVRRTASVRVFPSTAYGKEIYRRLRSVNVAAPTKMCRAMTRYGSDKGDGSHNFTTVYSVLFGTLQDRPLRIFELGLGTNNPGLLSTMGASGRPGASLRGWRDLFPCAQVYGADIDRSILFTEERIQTFYCDQMSSDAIRDLWSEPVLQSGVDILVEDGLHTFFANKSFMDGSLEHLRPGGTFVIEDINPKEIENWCTELETVYLKRFPDYEFALIDLPDALRADNILLVIRRPG